MRRTWRAALLLALALAMPGCAAAGPGEFYAPPAPMPPVAPGTLLREERMPAPEGAVAHRVLYASIGLDGGPIAVSGVVIVPDGKVPPGGRPVVAWAHPTSGVVPRCAPSLAFGLYEQIPGLAEMLRRGWVVAATDYPGLGTPGPHPYLVGTSAGRAVLDSVRAARAVAGAAASPRFAVWGHSQGGHAALFAAMLAPRDAPELELAGIAAAAPATELGTLMRDDFDTPGGRNLTAMTLWSWAQVYGAKLDAVVAPAARPVMDRLAGECIESVYDVVVRGFTGRGLQRTFLTVGDIAATEPWRSLLARNEPGLLPPRIPLFLAQGLADGLVRPAVTRDYMARLCRAGTRVRLLEVPGDGHAFIARDTAGAAVAWLAERFAGDPAPDDCRG